MEWSGAPNAIGLHSVITNTDTHPMTAVIAATKSASHSLSSLVRMYLQGKRLPQDRCFSIVGQA